MALLISLLVNTLALLVTDWLLSGIHFAGIRTVFLAAIVMGLINTFIRPVLIILTAPINILTLGLFTFVINAIVLTLTSMIIGPENFLIENFWWAIGAAIILSVVSTTLSMAVRDLEKDGGKKKKRK